ncbi:unnamed protein product [Symbiodinium sp. CCMP2592]|nr:unnamed protein product [Symbiodinium sp. CCMP2592]
MNPLLRAVAFSMTPQPQAIGEPEKEKPAPPQQKPEKEKSAPPQKKPEKEKSAPPQKNPEKEKPAPEKNPEKEKPASSQQKPEKEKPAITRKEGDIWWEETLGKACRQTKKGTDVSGQPSLNEAGSVVVVFEDGTEWLPPLIPADLAKFASSAGSVMSVPRKPKAASNKPVKPVADYCLPTIRAKFSKQGKCSPIIKVEARADRYNLSSAWKQRMQIVLKGDMTPTVGMNICSTFCDCYEHLNLNQGLLDFKHCRNNLIEMWQNGTHDFAASKMSWELLSKQMKDAFPPAPTMLYFTSEKSLAEEADEDEEPG